MKYMAKGYKKGCKKYQECDPTDSYSQALLDAQRMLDSGQYKVIVILYWCENNNNWFLRRIVK